MKKAGILRKQQRRDRLIRERVHDPYKTRLKLKDPTICPQCGAVYRGGRWQWEKQVPKDAREEVCQACHRANDGYPAGKVSLSGRFMMAHRNEIVNLARNVEKAENEDHPLHRIMSLKENNEQVLITMTDIHLPRRIGQAMFDAYKGDFDFQYDKAGYFIRVQWTRDD